MRNFQPPVGQYVYNFTNRRGWGVWEAPPPPPPALLPTGWASTPNKIVPAMLQIRNKAKEFENLDLIK